MSNFYEYIEEIYLETKNEEIINIFLIENEYVYYFNSSNLKYKIESKLSNLQKENHLKGKVFNYLLQKQILETDLKYSLIEDIHKTYLI